MSKITEHVGQRIRTCRKKKGYTIEEFSKMINKSKATLSKYENGSIAIDIDTLLDIAEALEMDLSHLVDYISPKSKRPAAHGNSYFNSAYFYVYYYTNIIPSTRRRFKYLSIYFSYSTNP